MLQFAELTSVGLDLACHLLPRNFRHSHHPHYRKNARRLRRRSRLELSLLEDRTLLSVSIAGTVFNDLNGSGQRTANDPGVAGQTVYLDLNNDGQLDNTVTTLTGPSTTLNESGPIATLLTEVGGFGTGIQVQNLPANFTDVAVSMDITNNSPDAIPICLVSPLGQEFVNFPLLFYLQPGETFDGTFDGNSTNPITLASNPVPNGTYAPEQAFSNPQFGINNSGTDGTWGLVMFGAPSDFTNNSSGVDLQSWSLTFTTAEPSTQTDANGNYSFTGLPAGTYSVNIVHSPADVVTAPTGGVAQSIALTDGQAATGVDFGEQPAPDLVATSFRLSAPATSWGQTVTVNYALTNQGLGTAPPFQVGIYLSNNGIISTSDHLLDTLQIGSLAAGASTIGTATVTLPASAPSGFDSLSTAYLGSIIDPNNAVTEENKANNSNQGAGIDLAVLGATVNTPVTTASGVQQDPSIAVDPNNSQHLVTAYMDYSLLSTGYAGISVAVSNDGGATWPTITSISLPAGFDQGAAAPTVAFDAQGNVYVSFMAATFLGPQPDITEPSSTQRPDGFQANNGIFVAKSTNGGASWSQPAAVIENTYSGTDVPFAAYPSMAIDTVAGSSNFGDLYVAWTQFYPPGQYPGNSTSTDGSNVMIAISKDGDDSWTTQMQNVPGTGAGTGLVSAIEDSNEATADTGPVGIGYVVYPTVSVGAGGTVYVSTWTGGHYGIYSSTNGGFSTGTPGNLVSGFTAPNYGTQTGLPFYSENNYVLTDPTFPNDNFRTLGLRDIVADPTRPGVVYAVAATALDQATPNPEDAVEASGIVFAVSDDYGQTWTSNFTVGSESSLLATVPVADLGSYEPVLNDENGGVFPGFASSTASQVLANQAMPSITVNAQGDISVIWYDTRNDPNGQALEVWGTVSTDGGQHFSSNFQVSNTSFNPNADAFPAANGDTNYYLGDQIGLASSNNAAYAVWTDGRNGNQDIYFASFALTPTPAAPADRYSPNNTMGSATEFGAVTAQEEWPQLALPAGNSQEWFHLEAGATGQLLVSVTPATPGANLQVELLDANGNVLQPVVTNVLDSSGNVIGQQYVIAANSGTGFYIQVSGSSTQALEYTLSAASLTYDFGTQVEANSPTGLDSSVATQTQNVYRLVAAVQGTLEVSLTAATVNSNGSSLQGGLNLEILGADGRTILATDYVGVGPGQTEQFNIPVIQGQIVFLVVLGDNLNSNVGDFTLSITNLDQYQLPTPQNVPYQQPNNLPPGGFNYFTIVVPASGTLQFTATLSNDFVSNAVAQIYAFPSQNYVTQSQNLVAGANQVSFSLTPGTVVYIAITSNDPNANGDYTLQFPNIDQTETGLQTLFFPTEGSPTSVQAADLTGNGRDDLVATDTDTTDALSVLMSNSDGLFQAPQEEAVGPGLSLGSLTAGFRQPAVVDSNNDGVLDVIVPNFRAGDISVLLGNGDGTFQPQRIFNALPDPEIVITGNFTGPNSNDLIVAQGTVTTSGGAEFAFLKSNGNGTYAPPVVYQTIFTGGLSTILTGDFTGNGDLDLMVFSQNSAFAQLFLGNGAGTFRDGGEIALGEDATSAAAVDLTGNGVLDLITTGGNSGDVYVQMGNGNGTFQAPVAYQVLAPKPGNLVALSALTIADFGSPPSPGSTTAGPADGHLDIIVTAAYRTGGSSAQVIMLPGLVDGNGNYAGFGAPVVLAQTAGTISDIAVGDFAGNGVTDLALPTTGGILVIYGKPLPLPANSTPQTTRDLGTITHAITLPQSINSNQEDAYFTMTVPTESAAGSGEEVLDFALSVQDAGGGGVQLAVLDANGNVLGSGTRFRVVAPQGAVLTLHVFGVAGSDGTPGSGAYTLDIDVLPQVVSVQAQEALPGAPFTSLVLTLQGDQLDPTAAMNPANYTVIWLGPDGIPGSADNQIIPIMALDGGQPVVYDTSAYTTVTSGLTYPTTVRQTITLLFASPLPAGSYEIELSPNIQTASFNADESSLLSGNSSFDGHSLVAVADGVVTNGGTVVLPNLVPASVPTTGSNITQGTAFLTQLQNDLGALLNSLLAQSGDSSTITAQINNEIQARFAADYAAASNSGTSPLSDVAIFWLDPLSFNLQTPQQGQQAAYNLQNNQVQNTANQTLVDVGGNVELVVMTGVSGTFKLNVGDVPDTARGGAVVLGSLSDQVASFTDGLRSGVTDFVLQIASAIDIPISTPISITVPSGPTNPGTPNTPNTPGNPGSPGTPGGPTVVEIGGATEASTSVVASASENAAALDTTQFVTLILLNTLLTGGAGEGFGGGASAASSAGAAGSGGSGGSGGAGSSAALAGSGSNAGNFLNDLQNAVDQIFQRWRDSREAGDNPYRFNATLAIDVVEKAAAQVQAELGALTGNQLSGVEAPWKYMLRVLGESSATAASALRQQFPALAPKTTTTPVPSVPMSLPESESDEEASLWDERLDAMLVEETPVATGEAYWSALFLAAGSVYAGWSDEAADETTPQKKPRLLQDEE